MRHRRTLGANVKTCAVESCPIAIASRFLMCLPHWYRVPAGLRMRIWAALTAWTNDPSDMKKLQTLQDLQADAVREVS